MQIGTLPDKVVDISDQIGAIDPNQPSGRDLVSIWQLRGDKKIDGDWDAESDEFDTKLFTDPSGLLWTERKHQLGKEEGEKRSREEKRG